MGHNGQSSANGGGGGGATLSKRIEHPTMTSHFPGKHLDQDDGADWIQKYTKLSRQEAKEAYESIKYFTGSGFTSIHHETSAIAIANAKRADKALTDPGMPVYKGELFRGVRFYDEPGMSAKQQINAILKNGKWKEPGLTSFSTRKQVALGFADSGDVRCIVHILNNKSGVSIRHISKFPNEDEVLMNSQRAKSGWNIKNYKWSGNQVDIYVVEP